MKLFFTVFILTVSLLHGLAGESLAQRLNIHQKRMNFYDLMVSIRQQTGYDFLVLDKSLSDQAKPVDLDSNEQSLQAVLDTYTAHQDFTYEIKKDEKTVVIKQKPTNSPAKNHSKKQAPPELQQPTITLSGTVADTTGHPIPAATIQVLKNNLGVSANGEGRFIFPNVPDDVILHVSSVGYEPLDIDIANLLSDNTAGQKNVKFKKVGDNFLSLDITLNASQNALEDVEITAVNTGYQKIKPEQSTGAVSVITTKDYESRISTNFLDGLVNKLPGLVINNDVKFTSTVNGVQTTNSLFNVRGISTMTGNQNPLIVVDGYPTELTLDMIDPNEIKSVTILKDAAAATVYGVRASNGVIVIERKQAVQGRPQFAFRATAGFTPKENYSRYRWDADASNISIDYDRYSYRTSVNANTFGNLSTFNGSSGYHLPFYVLAQQAGGIITPYQASKAFAAMGSYNNTGDYSRLLLQTAATQTYNLDISGGNPNALYYITSNYTGNQLQQINNDNNRIQLSGRSTLKFSKKFSLELTTDYQEERTNGVPVPDINSLYPYEHLKDADGNPSSVFSGSGINPYYNRVLMELGLEDNLYYPLVDVNAVSNKTHTINNRITANFDYKISNSFNLTFGGIYETSRTDTRHLASEQSSEAHQYVNSYVTKAADGSLLFNVPKGGFLQQQSAGTTGYTLRTQLNYNRQIGDGHSVNAILGAEVRDVTNQGSSASYFGYNDQTLLQQPVDYAGIVNGSILGTFASTRAISYPSLFGQQYGDNRYVSGYSNVVYAFRNTYSLTGSMRIDQSNLFGTDPRYRYKPLWSLGAAWNLDKEHFMQSIHWLKQLKLRVADGFNGNVAKMSLPQVIAKSYVNNLIAPASTALGLYSYANSGLRWEQTHSLNIGLDYHIFRNITGSIDYYNKKSTDLLASAFIDPTIGTSPSLINTASINNKGLEINLHADWISTSRFNWNTGFVLSRNKSNVLKVYQNTTFWPISLNAAGYLEGYPVGALFAYRWAGLNEKGYPQVENEKGDVYAINSISTSMYLSGDTTGTIRYMGSSVPAVNAGMSNRIDIGPFYLYCMINYYGGFKIQVPRPTPDAVRPLSGASNYWKQPGDEINTDVMSLAAFSGTSSSFYSSYAYNYADKYVVDGDYITIGDLTASYSFDHSDFFKKIGISHFELKLQASNVLTVGLNKYHYSMATGSYAKSYLTPTYTVGLFTNF